MATPRTRPEVEREIKRTLGIVPSFFDRMPDATLDFEWTLFQRFEMQEEGMAIPAKYRQLLGVGIHSETKCEYCTLFHSEFAKLLGATDEEVQEAVHYAKHTVGLSVYLNGIREPLDQFTNEVEEIIDFLGNTTAAKAV
ncbi:MAG: carboxymuconolactone decarboxylase family protein [Deltaproteobacteria bacterium]|nr:carboxymuconolactone decarboxylase family protein [Deltaproteobacteria bacterium]